MKKYLLILLIMIVTALAACEPADTDGPLQCIPGYEEVDGKCEEIVPECESDEILVDNVCVEEGDVNATYPGPVYQSQGYDTYEGRDIISDSCAHLENIGEWQPVWCDEFDYTGLPDTTMWGYDVGGNGGGNNELQYYTNADPDNVFVKNGILTITSLQESMGGKQYTSTRLVSRDKGDFLYGKIQVRAKVPAGTGTWPAIWMLPTDWEYGGWPTSGEIDIMEYVGYDPNKVHATIHTGAFYHGLGTQIGKVRSLSTAEEEFHVYELEWEPNVMRFYINGVKFFEVSYNPDTMNHVDVIDAWPFDKRFHLLINTAIGGDWGGVEGVDNDIFPVEFQIDYVRVFQKDYAGMDQADPDPVQNIRALDTRANTIFLGWDIGTDDVLVKEYKLYVDDVLVDTVSHNGHLFTGLSGDTSYSFKVVSVDFAGNESVASELVESTIAPLTVNDRIEAELFVDMYGIQVESCSDTGGGQNIGYTDSGDWFEYEIIVPESGQYQLVTRAAAQTSNAGFTLSYGGNYLVSVAVPSTGGWQTWQSLTSGTFQLDAGTYTFRVTANGDGFNINYFEFNKVG